MKHFNEIKIQENRIIGKRNEKIYGHFLEHFHRQVYGGIYDPNSPLSDENGFRKDVIEALKNISPPVLRWPGGCFVSAYHWKDGIGKHREPAFDKAWRVEDDNSFGTDEYMEFCRKINVEPYICTNAGSGTPEEMSDWVEYCNLKDQGKWAKSRIQNGHPEPYRVKYWSIGNENYLEGEIGPKSSQEWGQYVKVSAKMMKRVDPSIQLLAASTDDLDWNIKLLRTAGNLLDWISIHDYWDTLHQVNHPSDYETCMIKSLNVGDKIYKTKHILGALGCLGKIKIAFDEWNLRGWHHPSVDSATENFLTPRDNNDLNSTYTMADAVFTACFLNECLRNCDVVGMANFAPTVNTRGMIYTYDQGIILRPTYYVFELYTKYMGDIVVDSWTSSNTTFEVTDHEKTYIIPEMDITATIDSADQSLRVAVVNRSPEKEVEFYLNSTNIAEYRLLKRYTVWGESKDSYNDIVNPNDVKILEKEEPLLSGTGLSLKILPHSVNVLVLSK